MGANQAKEEAKARVIAETDPREIVVGLEGDPDAVPAGEVGDREEDVREKRGFWANVRRLIGREITDNLGFSIPIKMFEPTTNLTRASELFEFTELLDQAAACPDAALRAALIAAFFISEFRGYIDRKKPLTSMLGETFEWTRPDGGARVVGEMTESHPPAFGLHAEGTRGWSVDTAPGVKAKFFGNSLEMHVTTRTFVRLAASGDRPAETYAYTLPMMAIYGIFFGKRVFCWEGPAALDCLETGYRVALVYEKRRLEVHGTVFDPSGAACRLLQGACDEYVASAASPQEPRRDLWRCAPVDEARKRNPCNMTPFAMSLNDCSPARLAEVPPTDSRYRRDLAALLAGDHRVASAEKVKVEERQRARRRDAADRGRRLAPRWFRAGDAARGEELPWVYGGQYWGRARGLSAEERRTLELF